MDTRVAAYAVLVEERGVLLAHWNEAGHERWTLPGGGLEPGEDPRDAVVREVEEETGYLAAVDALLDVGSTVVPAERRLRRTDRPLHHLRILYRARVVGGRLRDEVGGTTDRAAWFSRAEVSALERTSLVDAGLRAAGVDAGR